MKLTDSQNTSFTKKGMSKCWAQCLLRQLMWPVRPSMPRWVKGMEILFLRLIPRMLLRINLMKRRFFHCQSRHQEKAIWSALTRVGLSSIFHAYLAVVRVSACRRRSGGRAGKEGNNGHLDGIKAVGDRLRGWREDGTYSRNFTAFAVVYLDHVPAPHGGNFTVWPKSHHFFEDYFKEHGHRC